MTAVRLRALVVDDEPLARRTLCELLERERDGEVVGVCGDGPSATEAVRAGRPDLLFLDVQMPELDGFGVLRAVRDVHVPAVVFVTAFGEHAVRAFDRARARIEAVRRDSTPEPGPHRWLERFAVECSGRITIIPVDTVQWIEAQDYYVQIHADGREHLLR